jgi:hypothetical protein
MNVCHLKSVWNFGSERWSLSEECIQDFDSEQNCLHLKSAPDFGSDQRPSSEDCLKSSPISGFRSTLQKIHSFKSSSSTSSRTIIWNISGDVGLVSAGRIDKDTSPLTTPGHTSKSSAMDISSYIFWIEIHEALEGRFHPSRDPHPVWCEARGLSVCLWNARG